MATVANVAVECPGCGEPIALALRAVTDPDAPPGEITLAVDRSGVDEHLQQVHPSGGREPTE